MQQKTRAVKEGVSEPAAAPPAPPSDPYLRLRVLNRGLVEVPIHNPAKRARNWCATVKADPNAPGGMTRRFWESGRGEFFHYILPEGLDRLDVIEFGADAVSYGGNRTPNRLYGVVGACTETELVLAAVATAVEAFAVAEDWRAQLMEGRR